MFRLRETGCCGMLELEDISAKERPEQVIDGMLSALQGITGGFSHLKPFITFTSVVKRVTGDHASNREDDYGLALANYITQNDLGTVHDSIPEARNWTGNYIKIWVWTLNYPALRARHEEASIKIRAANTVTINGNAASTTTIRW